MSAPSKTIHWPSLITIVSVAILVGTELLGAAWASGWAIAGFLQLGDIVAYVLQIVFGIIALIAVAAFLRKAIRVEPIFDRS